MNLRTFLAQRFRYTQELEQGVNELWNELLQSNRERAALGAQLQLTETWVNKIRGLLPGEHKPQTAIETLEAFTGAVEDMGVLMGAIIDYRNLLIRVDIPDIPGLKHDGVSAIFDKYGFKLERIKNPVGDVWANTSQNVREVQDEHQELMRDRD